MSAETSSIPLSKPQSIAKKLADRYPNKIPVIVNHVQNRLTRTKYIVPKDITVSEFIIHVRKMNPKLDSTEALFLFVDDILVTMNASINEIYTKHQNEDGFLYISCASENTFGSG